MESFTPFPLAGEGAEWGRGQTTRERKGKAIPRGLRLIIKETPWPNGMQLAPELLVYHLLTQCLPGFEHQGEALGPPVLDTRPYSMRSDRIDDQRASRRQPPQPSLVVDRRGRAIPPVTAPRRRHPPPQAASKRPPPPQLAATGAAR
jgi:hypothetical protein